MKILFANNFHYLRGGSERVFFEEMALLASHGQEVAPFSRQFQQNLPSEFSRYFSGPLAYEGVPLRQKMVAAAKLIYAPENRRQAGKLMDDFRPDLLHCHNIYGRLTTALLDAAKQRGIPVVMTLHDYKLVCPSYLMLRRNRVCNRCKGGRFHNCIAGRCHKGQMVPSAIYTAEAYLSSWLGKYDAVSRFLCPSRFLLEEHRAAGFPAERLMLVPNFIDISAFEPNFTPGGYILYAGRLSHEKGVGTLVEAASALRIPIKIVGDGPLRKELEFRARELSACSVEFLGYRNGGELRELFRNAAFLAFPSEWNENAPMTILEAFAYGKPVLGARIGGIPEMVREGTTGLLFEPGDVAGLRESMAALFADRDRIEVMGRQARAQVESENDADTHYRQLIGTYQDLVRRTR